MKSDDSRKFWEQVALWIEWSCDKRAIVAALAMSKLDGIVESNPGLATSLRPIGFSSEFTNYPRQIDVLKRNPRQFGLAVACSFSRYGYVREAAVRNLAAMQDERALPFLMLRSLDWVTSVANLAATAAEALMIRASDHAIRSAVDTCVVLARHPGERPNRLVRLFAEQLSSRSEILTDLRKSRSSQIQRFLFETHVQAPGEGIEALITHALMSGSPQAAFKAASHVSAAERHIQERLLPALAEISNPAVARVTMEVADALGREDLLWTGVLHPNWRVRNDARYYLKQRGNGGFRERYIAEFPLTAAIEGYSEVTQTDAELAELIPFLEHEQSRVRGAAVSALARREYRAAVPSLVHRLRDDPNTRVVREVVKALIKLGVSLTADQALAIMGDPGDTASQRRARQFALVLVPYWDRISIILILARNGTLEDSRGPSLQSRAGEYRRNLWRHEWNGAIGRSLPRGTPPPRKAQLDRALAELERAGDAIDKQAAEELRAELLRWAARAR